MKLKGPFWERLTPGDKEMALARMKKEELRVKRELEVCIHKKYSSILSGEFILSPTRFLSYL